MSDATVNALAQDEARIDSRFPASAVPAITSVRLSPGDAVDLVNISKSGVLVEGRTRFVPGTRVTVIFDGGFTPASVKGKVVRCQVSSISGGALRYQSGIQFEKRLEVLEPNVPAHPAPPAPGPVPAPVPIASAPRRVVNRW
jgi:hypothetical protein